MGHRAPSGLGHGLVHRRRRARHVGAGKLSVLTSEFPFRGVHFDVVSAIGMMTAAGSFRVQGLASRRSSACGERPCSANRRLGAWQRLHGPTCGTTPSVGQLRMSKKRLDTVGEFERPFSLARSEAASPLCDPLRKPASCNFLLKFDNSVRPFPEGHDSCFC